MQSGEMIFTRMDRVIFGKPAAQSIIAEADRLEAERVFLLTSGTLNRATGEIERIREALGGRYVGTHDDMPAHSPRSAVVACANAARKARADLLVTVGGGSVTDGGKAVTICLEHGITDVRVGLKQSYIHPGIIPQTVILDPAVTVHTPEWLWLSSGVRAIDHAVETLCSLDANEYTDGTSLQALRALADGLARVKANPADLEGRLRCQMGAWLSMVGIVTGTRLGASHAIGHILGGTANVPHGYTSCVMLPYVLAYNEPINADRQRDVSAALGQPGERASDILDGLIRGLGMPRTLREVGVDEARLPQLAENCMLDDWTFSNPRPIRTPGEVMEILQMAY